MPIRYTPEQERIQREGPDDNYPSGDHSQATIEVLDLVIGEKIGEKIYTALLRDPINFKLPVAMDIHIFPDGTVQAVERDLLDICGDYNIEDVDIDSIEV